MLLPQPDAPTKQTNSPFATLIDTSVNAVSAELPRPYVFDTVESRTASSTEGFCTERAQMYSSGWSCLDLRSADRLQHIVERCWIEQSVDDSTV